MNFKFLREIRQETAQSQDEGRWKSIFIRFSLLLVCMLSILPRIGSCVWYFTQGSFGCLGFAETRLDDSFFIVDLLLLHPSHVRSDEYFLMKISVDQCPKYAIFYVSQGCCSCLGFAETRPDHEFLVFFLFHSPSTTWLSFTIDRRAVVNHRRTLRHAAIHNRPPHLHSPSIAALSFTIDRNAFI